MNKIDDNFETVTCRICYKQYKKVFGRHLIKHNITKEKYLERFPGAPLNSPLDEETFIKSGGKHMKTDKYKKMFSEKMKGDKNPMHKSNTTEQFRKEQSPYSKEFYIKRYPELTDNQIAEKISIFAKGSAEGRLLPLHKEYWLERGYSEEESIQKVIDRQTTFSKEICIEKHGEEKGVQIWINRQKKWHDSINTNGNLKVGFSKISQELFNKISNFLGKDKCEYATNIGEYRLEKDNNKGYWLYDFKYKNKIIEYQGDIYHANPNIYEAHECPHPFYKELTAKDLWEKDYMKKETAVYNNYDIIYIWDSEYRDKGVEKKYEIVKRCIDFLIS
jgi:hypothetical protein